MFNQGMCLDLLPNSQNQQGKKSLLNSKEKRDVVTATAPHMCYLHDTLAVSFHPFNANVKEMVWPAK